MDYSTSEIITKLASQMAEQLRQRLDSGPATDPPAQLDQVETELRDMLRALGAEALSQYLSTTTEAVPRQVPCPCGGKVTYQREREAVVISLFGRVSYRRAYYAGCDCGQGQAPRDVQMGLQPGTVSPGLANLLALGGIELAFEQSVTWLEAFLGFRVSENTIRQETEALGAYQAAQDAICAQQGQDEDFLQTQLRQGPAAPDRLYGSIDAAKVRMEPRTQAADGEKWRDVKVGCWYQTRAVSPAQRSARQREKAAREPLVCRAHHQRYYCAIDEADTFGQLLWGTGCQLGAERARELVFVCDGAAWIWNLVEHYYSRAVQIVDWYHAEDYLKRVADAAWPDPNARANWLEPTTQALWDGQVETVIGACQALAARSAEARNAVAYFTTHAQRMRYAHFRAQGYLIGSGTVESACKQIVTQRLKRSGAQWTRPGAVNTAKARAVWLSGQWDDLRARYAQRPLAG